MTVDNISATGFTGPVMGPERGTGVAYTVRAPAILGLRASYARPPDASAYPAPLPPVPLMIHNIPNILSLRCPLRILATSWLTRGTQYGG